MHSRLPRGVRPHLEGKQRTSLSSQFATPISWSPMSGLKGVEPPLQFGERTRDCSPGQAGKEGAHLERTGASQGFPRAAAPVGVFSRGTTRISGSLSCGQVSMRVARGSASWLSSHGRGLGPRDALKKDSRGLCRGAAGNPRFPRLLPGTLGNFPGCL